MAGFLPSILVLGFLALVALALPRRTAADAKAERIAASRALMLATLLQALHFAEETAWHFHVHFPALFGLPPIPLWLFMAFNALLLMAWLVSIRGVRSGRPLTLYAAWFLALAGMLNGIAHPLLAVAAGGYFPGLASSPLMGAAGIWLWMKLRQATRGAPGLKS